jgi:hypothetical protein
MVDPLPDLGALDDDGLRQLIDKYVDEENQVSYRRRILHGYIDILRSELIARKKAEYGEGGTSEGLDIDRLSQILSGKGLPKDSDES